jgi:cellulose synthase operon protein C
MSLFASLGCARFVRAISALAVLSLAACDSPDERAQTYYEQGMNLLAKKDPSRASIEMKNALQLRGDFVPALRALAQIEEDAQNWPAVAAILRRLAPIEPRDIDIRLRLARLSLLRGALLEAREWVDAAVAIDQQSASAHALRALIMLKDNVEGEAVKEAQHAIELNADNLEATMVLAAARLAHDDANGALRILDRIPTSGRKDLGFALFRIKVYEQQGNFLEAQQRLEHLVELNPREPSLRAQLLQFYLAHGHPQEAEQLLRSIEAANPGNTKAGLDVVRLISVIKGPSAARQELLTRIAAGGDVFDYQMALADLERANGNITDGIQRIESLIRNLKDAERILTARYLLAQMYIENKNLDAAEPMVADIFRDDPRKTNAFRLRASIRLEQGRLEEAVADLRQALSDQPHSAELQSLLAVAYERSGSIDLAERQLADAMRASDFAPSYGLNYVGLLQRRGDNALAEDVLNELVRRHPTDISILSSLAQARLARQDWAAARETAEAIGRLGGQRAVADQILAAVLDGQKRYADSIALLENAAAASPGAPQLMFSLVRSYVLAGQAAKAESYVDYLLGKDPANAEALVLKGLLRATGKTDDAIKSFKAAIEAQPKDAIGYRALAEFYADRKQYDEALSILRAGLLVQPASMPLRLAEAGILELKGNFEDAIAQYEALLREQPGALVVANNLASLLSEHRGDKASLERALSLAKSLAKSQVPQFKDTLGWISHLHGDTPTAISLLEEAVTDLPKDPTVRYHLAMTYISAGQSEKAKAELRKASELLPPGGGALADKIRAALRG